MSSLPPCLAQRREGLGYLETTQMPVSPLFAHHTTSDNANSTFVASPREVPVVSGGSLWVWGRVRGGVGAMDSSEEFPGDRELGGRVICQMQAAICQVLTVHREEGRGME